MVKKLVIAVVVLAVVGVAYVSLKKGRLPSAEDIKDMTQGLDVDLTSGKGKLIAARGGATVVRADGAEEACKVGVLIAEGDTLKTSADGRCCVQFDDKTTVRLDANTKLSVTQLKKAGTTRIFKNHLRLDAGRILANVPTRVDQKSEVEVVTVAGTLGVRGTRFGAGVDETGRTSLAVYEGVVDVTAQGKTVAVSADKGVVVEAGKTPTEAVALAGPPELLTPADRAKVHTQAVAFTWSAGAGAQAYRFELSRNPAFHDIVADAVVKDTTYAVPSIAIDSPYYFRVSSIGKLGLEGAASQHRTIFYEYHMGQQ